MHPAINKRDEQFFDFCQTDLLPPINYYPLPTFATNLAFFQQALINNYYKFSSKGPRNGKKQIENFNNQESDREI